MNNNKLTTNKLTNYRLNRQLFTIIEDIEQPVYSYVNKNTNLDYLLNFYKKQKNKKKLYELSNKNNLLCLFNEFI